ncbi:MAG: hypothetical protein AB7V42_08125 [Thermoleophilia bacterium]
MTDLQRLAEEAGRYVQALEPSTDELSHVLTRVAADRAPTRRPRRRRRAIFVIVPIAVALAGTAYAAFLDDDPVVTAAAPVDCRADVDGLSGSAEAADGRSPLEICRESWARETMDPVRWPAGDPPLTACGTIVLPTDDPAVCERKGLPTALPSDYATTATRIDALRGALVDLSVAHRGCWPLTDARSAFTRELRIRGFDAWTVTLPTRSAEQAQARPCAGSLSIDAPNRRIVIVPGPPPGDGSDTGDGHRA